MKYESAVLLEKIKGKDEHIAKLTGMIDQIAQNVRSSVQPNQVQERLESIRQSIEKSEAITSSIEMPKKVKKRDTIKRQNSKESVEMREATENASQAKLKSPKKLSTSITPAH